MSSSPRGPPPPFSPAFEASLLLPLPPLPPLPFDPLSFILTGFPSSPSLQSGHYSGLVVQVNRAISGLSKGRAVKADDSDEHDRTLRAVGGMCEVCCELLESVKVMRELEEERMEKEKDSAERRHSAKHSPSAASQPAASSSSSAAAPASPSSSSPSPPRSPSDFPALDSLRSHLVLTIRSLRSLSLLISAIDTLPLVLPGKDYQGISRLLAYITRLTAVLAPYAALPILTTLQSHLSTHLQSLQRIILSELYTVLPAVTAETSVPTLALCVSLLDVYTPDVRAEVVQWWAAARLQSYQAKAFPASIDSVEDMSRWLYAELSDYEIDCYNRIFPASWFVSAQLVKRWMDLTLPVLQTRLADLTEKGEKVDLYKPLSVVLQLEDYLLREVAMEKEERDGVLVGRWEWKGMLSSAFMPYIHTFVVLEQERLSKQLQRIEREEQWAVGDEADDGQRLVGFDRLLVVVHKSLDKYRQIIHNETMFGLFKEYRRCLLDYVKMLERHIPYAGGAVGPQAAQAGGGGGAAGGSGITASGVAGGSNGGVNLVLTKQEVTSVILILNTADYVLTRVPSLVASVTAAVDAEYQPHVSFSGVQERVSKVHTKACSALSLSLCNRLDPVLLSIKEGKRDLLGHGAGEESAFVKQMVAVIRREVQRLVQLSSYPSILQAFLSRFCTLYVLRVRGVGHISDVFAEQLLVDTQVVRQALSSLPGIKQPEKDAAGKGSKKKKGEKEREKEREKDKEKERGEEKEKEKEHSKEPAVAAVTTTVEERREEKEKESSGGSDSDALKKEASREDIRSNGNGDSSSSSSSTSSPPLSLTSSASSSPMMTSASAMSGPEAVAALAAASAAAAASSSSSSPSSSSVPVSSRPSHPSASLVAAALSSLQSDLSSTPIGPPASSSPAPPSDPYLTVIAHHLSPLCKQLTVLTSPTANFIATFRRLFPRAPSSLLIELMDLRGITSRDQERLVKLWNASVGSSSSKRVDWVQRDFMTNFFGDLKKTINTNL